MKNPISDPHNLKNTPDSQDATHKNRKKQKLEKALRANLQRRKAAPRPSKPAPTTDGSV